MTERGLNPHVIFEGWQNAEAVRALYHQADIFVLPSFAEGIPVVLMEAMAMEIPCVATRITGIPELIRDPMDGLLVTPSSEEELAAAMARLMDDPKLRHAARKIRTAASSRQITISAATSPSSVLFSASSSSRMSKKDDRLFLMANGSNDRRGFLRGLTAASGLAAAAAAPGQAQTSADRASIATFPAMRARNNINR